MEIQSLFDFKINNYERSEVNMVITYNTTNKYKADTLSWLGYHYFKYDKPEGKVYAFEKTPEFMRTLEAMKEFKNKYGKKNK